MSSHNRKRPLFRRDSYMQGLGGCPPEVPPPAPPADGQAGQLGNVPTLVLACVGPTSFQIQANFPAEDHAQFLADALAVVLRASKVKKGGIITPDQLEGT